MRESDEQLYSRFIRDRSNDDLKELLDRYRESLTLFLFGLVHDIEDAEELMMDSFAVLVSGTSRFSGKSSFKTWLFAVGRNLALKHLRKHRNVTGRIEDDIPEDLSAGLETRPEMDLINDERNRQLYTAMEMLNPDYRQVLYLIYFEEMSCEEAAAIMKKNKKQVYNLAARGRQALKDELGKMGFEYAQF